MKKELTTLVRKRFNNYINYEINNKINICTYKRKGFSVLDTECNLSNTN